MITKPVAIGTIPDTGARAATTNFDDVYPELYRSAYRVAFRLLGGREEAADVAQEACARAYSRWSKVSAYDHPAAWVTRVAGNLAIDHLRRHRTAARHVGQVVAPAEPTAERVDLYRALLLLPRRQREVVLLRFIADQSEAAVAAALGCAIGTVKSHASRGLAALRITLGKEID
ncbi:MAG TPA: SigE family RNA polymerase sigma factor [Acidimicrobiia bacterium]|jgi:RNA polymerase sigma-70 factor (sigma-E family)|nr:SigE family RNA polymerase sigma factor [Acidimicrobiia bacterium]